MFTVTWLPKVDHTKVLVLLNDISIQCKHDMHHVQCFYPQNTAAVPSVCTSSLYDRHIHIAHVVHIRIDVRTAVVTDAYTYVGSVQA